MTETMSFAMTEAVSAPDASAETKPSPASGAAQGRPVKLLGLIAALLAAVGALLVDGELELTFFMAAAVICSLAAFDAALDRRIDAFWPWMLVSVGILGKTVPTVVSRLSDHLGPDAERFDHVGSVLIGLCVAAVAFMLARPPAGAEQRNPIAAIVVLAGLAGAVAGASIAFAGASGLGSARAARVFETIGWGTAAAILAGVAIAVGGSRRPPLPLLVLVVGACGVAILSARTASGAAVELGWWALAFLAMGAGSLGFKYASLGQRSGRRATLTPTVVAVVAAVLSIQAMVLALGDSGTWGPGIVLLPLLALALLGLGLTLYRWGGTGEVAHDDESAAVFDMIADSNLDADTSVDVAGQAAFQVAASQSSASEPSAALASADAVDAPAKPVAASSAFSGAIASTPVDAAPDANVPASPAEPAPTAPQPAPPAPPAAQPQASPPPATPTPQPEAPAPAPAAPEPEPAPEPALAAAQPVVHTVAEPTEPRPDVSTEGLAPHLIDPATGLRSVAGLQAVLVDAFNRPRQAGEVSIVMVALRNLGQVEATHGRVASARVVSELATRFSSRLPDAYTARFASDAFAAVIEGAALDTQVLIPRCADVLSELLEPVAVGDAAIEIDVAASMAQCYANEDIAGFIGRANTGLERAVAATEPSLIAMP